MITTSDDNVEALLEQASPRPVPPGRDERMIREAVHAEWQVVTDRRRSRTQTTRFAVAATVLMAVTVSFYLLRDAGIAPVQVATITKSHGSIYMLGPQSELHELDDMSAITAGQTIKTGIDSGIGLEWGNGGSLRIAADTRIEFISAEEVFLRSGKIYFDSKPSELITNIPSGSTEPAFRIQTNHGVVTHLGTQYMTTTGSDALVVMVREGEVSVTGKYRDAIAHEGKRLEIAGSASPSITDISRHGAIWDWIEATAPVANVDGRSVDEFLRWVGRETGLKINYESPQAEQIAQDGILKGQVDMDPRSALEILMMGTDLEWSYSENGGVIDVEFARRK